MRGSCDYKAKLSANYATRDPQAAHGNLKKPIENSSLGSSVDTCIDGTRQRASDALHAICEDAKGEAASLAKRKTPRRH
jgi:hypothetical protein